jgi:hypothetical protein
MRLASHTAYGGDDYKNDLGCKAIRVFNTIDGFGEFTILLQPSFRSQPNLAPAVLIRSFLRHRTCLIYSLLPPVIRTPLRGRSSLRYD